MKGISGLVFAGILALSTLAARGDIMQESKGKYADVNGLKMYYEIHGSGRPLVLLHGAFGLANGWGALIPFLTKNHQVIAVEVQGHGHTADRDTPLSFEQMADDT